jgi:hypothetical protein
MAGEAWGGRRGVDRVARGRTDGAGSDGWCGRGERARGVSRLGVRGSVGPLGPGDGSLVHHPR